VTAVVFTVLADPVDATGALVVLTACVVRVPADVEGVVVVGAVVVLVPLELGVDDPDDEPDPPLGTDEPVPVPEDDATAGQPSCWSTTSCFLAAVRAVWSVARFCWAELSWSLAELRPDAVCARWLVVPPARAVASVCSSFASVALADARVDFASVALMRPSTWPFFTFEPTETVSDVSVPLVANVGDSVSAVEMFPEADTLDCTVPRATVTVRATPLAAAEDEP
jgi:hypothetical protein